MTLTLTPIHGLPLYQKDDPLTSTILEAIRVEGIELRDSDILVIAQKIVSKVEGRLVYLGDITPSSKAYQLAEVTGKDPRFVELVLRESKSTLRVRGGTLIVEHNLGFICANAGIDHSNVKGLYGSDDDWVLLLPENPDQSAENLRREILGFSGKNVGILIIDSHGRAWRMGVVGTTIGLAGIPGLVDKRGDPDLFGYRLKVTQIAAADELAAAASLIMGQADEAVPVVHVRGFPYPLRDGCLQELIRPQEQDLFR